MDPRDATRFAGIFAVAIVLLIVAGATALWLERGPVILLDLEVIATALCL